MYSEMMAESHMRSGRVTRRQWEIVRRGGLRLEVLREGDIRVAGKTYPHRQLLKHLGYRWDGSNWVKRMRNREDGEKIAIWDGEKLHQHGIPVLVVGRHGYPEDSEVLYYGE